MTWSLDAKAHLSLHNKKQMTVLKKVVTLEPLISAETSETFRKFIELSKFIEETQCDENKPRQCVAT